MCFLFFIIPHIHIIIFKEMTKIYFFKTLYFHIFLFKKKHNSWTHNIIHTMHTAAHMLVGPF